MSNQDVFMSREFKRSRKAYAAQCTFEYLIALLVSDAFLAKLLTNIGVSDAMIGIISSFISLAFVIQLASIFLVRISLSTKKTVILFDTLSQFFFMFIYIVPFIQCSTQLKKVLVVVAVFAAYTGKYLIISICYKWANSYVEPLKRATYSAVKEIISLVAGIVFTMFVGKVIDNYESIGDLNGAFMFIAVAMLIINLCNFISLIFIKSDSKKEHDANAKPLRDVISTLFKNKDFRDIVILSVLWDTGRYFSIGFMGSFKTNDLLISVFVVQAINMVASACRILVSKPLAQISDRHSFAKGFEIGLYMAAAAFFINIFTTPSRWQFIIIYTILYNCCQAGTNQNNYNITYSYVGADYITQAMAIKNCIGGISGFCASVIGSRILAHVQGNDNQVMGVHIYGQQLLSCISFTLIVITILFIRFVILKKKVIKQ